MKVTVIKKHLSSFPNPINIEQGELVQVGKKDTQFTGWIWTTTSDGNSGWAPERLLDISGTNTTVREDYNAHELDTEVGEELTVHREINEWYWLSNAAGEFGWAPVKTVAEV